MSGHIHDRARVKILVPLVQHSKQHSFSLVVELKWGCIMSNAYKYTYFTVYSILSSLILPFLEATAYSTNALSFLQMIPQPFFEPRAIELFTLIAVPYIDLRYAVQENA